MKKFNSISKLLTAIKSCTDAAGFKMATALVRQYRMMNEPRKGAKSGTYIELLAALEDKRISLKGG